MHNITNIINLTPHSITFMTPEKDVLAIIEPSGSITRVSAKTETTGSIVFNGSAIPVSETVFGEVEGLPDPKDGTIFVVSSLVASRVPERTDVFIPAESVRDEAGRIIGALSLGRV